MTHLTLNHPAAGNTAPLHLDRRVVTAAVTVVAGVLLAAGAYVLLPAAALFWLAYNAPVRSESEFAFSSIPLAGGAMLATLLTAAAAGLCVAHTPALFALTFFGSALIMLERRNAHGRE